MSPERPRNDGHGRPADEPRACVECLARSALLQMLSARIEHAGSTPSRLLELLRLQDEQLICAIGGRKRQELKERHMALLAEPQPPIAVPTLCHHGRLHTRLFADRLDQPAALYVDGDLQRLRQALDAPIVAIVGSSQASDYGMEMAAALSRSLATSGVSVVAGFAPGIPAACHLGVLEAGAAPLAVMPGGVDVCVPIRLRGLHTRVIAGGTAISELPRGFRPRRWSARYCERMLAALARLVILVEGERDGAGMLAARLAGAHGARIGAVPGRITSPGSRGPHSLLREGAAALIASAKDALDLLYGVDAPALKDRCENLSPQQRAVLERVGSGEDTLAELCMNGEDEDTLVALSELRCNRLLARGDGGRYLPRVSLDRTCIRGGSEDRKQAPRTG